MPKQVPFEDILDHIPADVQQLRYVQHRHRLGQRQDKALERFGMPPSWLGQYEAQSCGQSHMTHTQSMTPRRTADRLETNAPCAAIVSIHPSGGYRSLGSMDSGPASPRCTHTERYSPLNFCRMYSHSQADRAHGTSGSWTWRFILLVFIGVKNLMNRMSFHFVKVRFCRMNLKFSQCE